MGYKQTDTCLAKVADDEPIFVLRAKDKLAPVLVALWCELAGLHGCPDAKIAEASGLRDLMRGWQAEHGCTWPD
jgi:hypothetical protein